MLKERLITAKEAAERLAIHKSSIYRFMREQKFTEIKLDPESQATIRYLDSEITEFIKRRISEAERGERRVHLKLLAQQ